MNCPIVLTPKAIEMVKAATGPEAGTILRAGVTGGGCSGYNYSLEIVEKANDKDFKFEQDGLPIIVDPISTQYLKGTTVDYVSVGLTAGFVFKNEIHRQCGCGESFAFGR
jgi:iron-sulfur cluster assembly protein